MPKEKKKAVKHLANLPKRPRDKENKPVETFTNMKDFTGDTKAEKLSFLTNIANNGADFKAQMGLDADAFTAFTAAVTAAVQAQTDADAAAAASKQGTSAANQMIQALITQVRAMANAARASTISDDDLASLGISRRSLVPTPVSAPVIAPSIRIDALSPGSADIGYSTPGASGPRQKPPNVTGIQISARQDSSVLAPEAGVMTVGTTTPVEIDTTLTPFSRVKIVARYVTQRGLYGPWSDPIEFNPQPA